MSVVLVTGGTGTLGRPLVAQLRAEGHGVRVLSRRAGSGTHVGNLATGAGVRAAVSGADVVVHAASDTRRLGRADLVQTQTLLRECGAAAHVVYVSIVGVDRIPFAYYRRKLACEGVVRDAGRPWTILRATQFHELVAGVLGAMAHLPVAPLPLDFRFQPVAAADVAAHLCGVVVDGPARDVLCFGGPEDLTLRAMAATWREAHAGRPGRVWNVPLPGRVADGFRQGHTTCPGAPRGTERWARFVTTGR